MVQDVSSGPTEDPVAPGGRRPAAFVVWGTWALMLAAALAYVARYGSNVPSWDGWDMVPTAVGAQPVTASWLWSQHNEHRVPLPRLVMLALYRPFGIDFRIAMTFNVLVSAGLAAGMILTARARRGWTSAWDAFFPLLMLNLGQGLNFIWAWQVEFYLSTALAVLALLVVVRSGDRPGVAAGAGVATLLVLLVLCGAHGMVLVPPMAVWTGAIGVDLLLEPGRRGRAGAILVLSLTAVALAAVVLYLVGYESVPGHPETPRPLTILKTAVRFLTLGFGSAVIPLWPYPDLAVIGIILASTGLLVASLFARPGRWRPAGGLLSFLGAMGLLALAVGMGRTDPNPRYVTLATPFLACVYFLWDTHAPPRAGRAARALLCAAALLALWPNTRAGLEYAADLRGQLAAFERDMIAGVPPHRLICRHAESLHIRHDLLTDYMPLLRRAGVGAFRALAPDPPFSEIPVPLEPAVPPQVDWDARTATATFGEGCPPLVFELGADRRVDGIRIRYRHRNESGTAPVIVLTWDSGGRRQSKVVGPTGDRCNWERGTWLRRDDADPTATAWICDTIRRIEVVPHFRPGTFQFLAIDLLVAEPGRSGPAPRRGPARSQDPGRTLIRPGRRRGGRSSRTRRARCKLTPTRRGIVR